MTTEEIFNYLWYEGDGADFTWRTDVERLAEKMYRDGWRRVPKGEWLTDKYGMERSICSICGAVFEGDGGNYCRKCGARMTDE